MSRMGSLYYRERRRLQSLKGRNPFRYVSFHKENTFGKHRKHKLAKLARRVSVRQRMRARKS